TRDLVEAEAQFVAHLDGAGCAVAPPVRSHSGQWVETIATRSGAIHAAAFWAVHGQPVRWGDDAENRRILHERGELLARIHNASETIHPPAAGGPRRFRWDEDDLFAQPPEASLPEGDDIARNERDALLAWLRALPE